MQSPERLRLLLILTVVDIRAVGPGVWNDWKRQLLRDLVRCRRGAAAARPQAARPAPSGSPRASRSWPTRCGWKAAAARAHARRLPDSYWLAEPLEWQLANARQVAAAEAHIGEARASVGRASTMPTRGATRITVFAPDRPGLFYRICAALSRGRRNIIDARIHTTRDGMALDNLLVQDAPGAAYADTPAAQAAGPRGRERRCAATQPPPLPEAEPLPGREPPSPIAPSRVRR